MHLEIEEKNDSNWDDGSLAACRNSAIVRHLCNTLLNLLLTCCLIHQTSRLSNHKFVLAACLPRPPPHTLQCDGSLLIRRRACLELHNTARDLRCALVASPFIFLSAVCGCTSPGDIQTLSALSSLTYPSPDRKWRAVLERKKKGGKKEEGKVEGETLRLITIHAEASAVPRKLADEKNGQ